MLGIGIALIALALMLMCVMALVLIRMRKKTSKKRGKKGCGPGLCPVHSVFLTCAHALHLHHNLLHWHVLVPSHASIFIVEEMLLR